MKKVKVEDAGEANLANGSDVVGNGLVPIAGGQSQNQRKIRRRLRQAQTADDVDISVTGRKPHAAPLVQYCHQQSCTVKIKAVGGSAGHIKAGGHHQRLNFRKNGPGSLHGTGHAGTGGIQGPPGQKHFRGVLHLF